jgi:hypothetical protein
MSDIGEGYSAGACSGSGYASPDLLCARVLQQETVEARHHRPKPLPFSLMLAYID